MLDSLKQTSKGKDYIFAADVFCVTVQRKAALVFLYSALRQGWFGLVLNLFRVHFVVAFTMNDLLTSWGVEGLQKSVQKVWKTLPKCLCWVIWKDARCLERKTKTVPKITSNCLWLLAFWCNLQNAKMLKMKITCWVHRFTTGIGAHSRENLLFVLVQKGCELSWH